MQENLIMDIGLHTGQDTKVYLDQGYNVLAVDANPVLVQKGREFFSREIANGKLTILNVGIADTPGMMPFYINKKRTQWSSFDRSMATRLGDPYQIVEVPCVTMSSIYAQNGVPYYLKTDIEGADMLCIRDLPDHDLPRYLSAEVSGLETLELLKDKGFKSFKLINQYDHFRPYTVWKEKSTLYQSWSWFRTGMQKRLEKIVPIKYVYGSSGPFGEATKGEWLDYSSMHGIIDDLYTYHRHAANSPVWYDLHAKAD
ncbi:MAG: FkbM family methyltransferase [Anaerolineaceae bacterium]|jgi:FkbM family methyltransferase